MIRDGMIAEDLSAAYCSTYVGSGAGTGAPRATPQNYGTDVVFILTLSEQSNPEGFVRLDRNP